MVARSRAIETNGLQVAEPLYRFLVDEALPGSGVEPTAFWSGFSQLIHEASPRNRELLARRCALQNQIDAWHHEQRAEYVDQKAYRRFLEEIGYIEQVISDFTLKSTGVDTEISEIPGPQLVVPVTNARYVLNAANARWGSLYDALYGTDALGDPPPVGDYDPARGARVITWSKAFLDDVVPLAGGSHSAVREYLIHDGRLVAVTEAGDRLSLRRPEQLAGYRADPGSPSSVLFVNHGLHIELVIDRAHRVGAHDLAGLADVVLEAAVTSIVDFEDSVAAVDAEDKVSGYRNWRQLMTGELVAEVEKGGKAFTRRLADNRCYTTPNGDEIALPGRSLLLVRNVGLYMTTNAVLDRDGNEVPEGLLDAVVTVLCALPDLLGDQPGRNSQAGSIYVVKPKLHGSDEVAFTDQVFSQVEAFLGLPRYTVKLGIMDEERRTSVNLEQCVRASANRLAFVNTGFLDRTGDEIHTSMEAGAVVRKAEMRNSSWFGAYEDRNVDVGIRGGLPGRGQIGKGMWAAPDEMAKMLAEKIAQCGAGASCAWVPSPTAATLHATHYHRVDVHKRQNELATRPLTPVDNLLIVPVVPEVRWSAEERQLELENNAQGILGYVVRWVDQGVGCSKVPDLHNVALMEDRATCRISSQHIANWLRHGVVDAEEVTAAMRRMAAVVDQQNTDDPAYEPMAPAYDGLAFRAACALVFEGAEQPSGYTDSLLHRYRLERKQRTDA